MVSTKRVWDKIFIPPCFGIPEKHTQDACVECPVAQDCIVECFETLDREYIELRKKRMTMREEVENERRTGKATR